MNIVEHTFKDIDEALRFIEIKEKEILSKARPSSPPLMIRSMENMFRKPFDESLLDEIMISPNSIDYPLASFYNDATDDKFIINGLFSGRYSLKPNLCRRVFLFRGENEFHSPSYPSIFRKCKDTYLEDMILIDEISVLLMNHPLVRLLHSGVDIRGKKIAFEMNTYGLAQHYETKTSLMDLTSDMNVAAFFATSHLKDGRYLPIEDESKEGVIYLFKIDENRFSPQYAMAGKSTLHTIGLQLFPRSGQQKGFIFDMLHGDDFNEQREVCVIKFRHNAQKSQKYYDMMDGGNRLFPDDILYDYCKRADRKKVSRAAIIKNLERNKGETYESLEKQLRILGFTITEEAPTFTSAELVKFYNELHNGGWEQFCRQIYIPAGCKELSYDDLLELPSREEYKRAFGYK